jgi:hypothetical protein
MDFEMLREQTCASLALLAPQLQGGAAQLVDECFASAQASFKTEFLLQLSPQAWARIALLYASSFVETEADVSVGAIFANVIRDSIHLSRLEMLTLELAQRSAGEAAERKTGEPAQRKAPVLTVVRNS